MKHQDKQLSQRMYQVVPAPALIMVLGVVLLGLLCPGLQAEARSNNTLARRLVTMGGVERGLCVVIGGPSALPVQVARSSHLVVHVREPDPHVLVQKRQLAQEAGLGIDRLVIEQGSIENLPYADNLVDLVLVTAADAATLAQLSASEVLRILVPQGTALLGAAEDITAEQLRKWGRGEEINDIQVGLGRRAAWLRLYKPTPEGVDDWSHWEHGPDNNPVSTDQVIKAPYMTQFLAEPYYIGMPAITTAAGGRTFLAIGNIGHHEREWDTLNQLIARNGYNGAILWQQALPDGYLCHRSAFIATADIFYRIDGDGCLMLDARTGVSKGRIQIPGLEGDWKWMAMQDGVLYVMAGDGAGKTELVQGNRNFGGWSWADLSAGYYGRPRVPWGFGHNLAAYHLDNERVLWQHTEATPIDSRALAVYDNQLFVYCPDTHLRSLNCLTGAPVWTNGDREILRLIEEPGRGLVSTPGFRSACLAVAGPGALIIQGQTRMNVIAVSTQNGALLWQKKKITNNPNAIFLDNQAVLGVGPNSAHVVLDPISGSVLDNYHFRKAACTRLTASPDSLFVRGEGILRFDRASKKTLIDGGVRPACNDGALPANGMLYIGPWSCDCNLSLIGSMGKCSAGNFQFRHPATNADRLQSPGTSKEVTALDVTEDDWPTYRGNNQRTSSTRASLARPNAKPGARRASAWIYTPAQAHTPTAPVSAGGLVFVAGQDGAVRALDAHSGKLRWRFNTVAPIKASPTVAESRVYVGSGDGHVYALEAATGRLLWRFRAAPVERHIMVYGNLCSTWPVNTGVLVSDGVAYFAAGIIDSDGTYVYAVDARTGKIKWQNDTCGHLNAELRKGVSAQGILTIQRGQLLMAGGNQVSPARFDLDTGECLNQGFAQGNPKANHGKFVGVFPGGHAIAGGRVLYASPENVANKDSFVVHTDKRVMALNFGGISPAWNDETVALVNFRDGQLLCADSDKAVERIEKGFPKPAMPRPQRWRCLAETLKGDDGVRWTSDLDQKAFEVVSLAVCPSSVVAVVKYQNRIRARAEWFLIAFNARNGTPLGFWHYPLPSKPLPEGLLVGRDGQIVLAMLNGNVRSFGPKQTQLPQRDRPAPPPNRAGRD